MFLAKFVGWYLAVHHKVPFLMLGTLAPIYNPNHTVFGIPSLPFGLSRLILKRCYGIMYDREKAIDSAIGAGVCDRFSKETYLNALFETPCLPMVNLMSPVIADVLFPFGGSERSSLHRFVGTTVIESANQLERGSLDSFGGKSTLRQLASFLQAEGLPKPVYIGWGSMTCKSPEHMVEFCARAVRHSAQRAVVLGGFAGLSMELLESLDSVDSGLGDYARNNILFVQQAPHEWLFPQVAATVHHGGAGTTAAALRAGVPTIITPVFVDQFDFSYVVRQMDIGVGFEKQFQKISWKELGDAISHVIEDKGIRENARAVGATLRAEDGAGTAVEEIERFWKEYCLTGKFHELFPEPEKPQTVGSSPKKSRPISSLLVFCIVTLSLLYVVALLIPFLLNLAHVGHVKVHYSGRFTARNNGDSYP